ncbi:MAG: DUF997 family protein [Synergistaceae bacterium]|jgi:uncharacterized membrane protein YhdT|nr:DUF997 family protein [Synergistaceae bacterium]
MVIGDNSRDYSFSDVELDPRFKRCEYEMLLTFGSWIVWALCSVGLSYYLAQGGAENMTYTCGVPSWFFWGIFVTTGVFFVVVCFFSTLVFKNMELFDTSAQGK